MSKNIVAYYHICYERKIIFDDEEKLVKQGYKLGPKENFKPRIQVKNTEDGIELVTNLDKSLEVK